MQVEVFKDMTLQVVVRATTACVVNIRGRHQIDGVKGKIKDINISYTIDGVTRNSNLQTYVITGAANVIPVQQIPKGILFDLVISVTTANIQRCQCYVSAGFLKENTDTKPFVTLIPGGYITSAKNIDLNSPFEDSLSGRGFIGLEQVANPAAGTFVTYTPGNYLLARVDGFSIDFTTSVSVANRIVTANIAYSESYDGFYLESQYVHVSGLTKRYYLMNVGYPLPDPTIVTDKKYLNSFPLPIILQDTEGLQMDAINIQAGDQFSNFSVRTEKWIKA